MAPRLMPRHDFVPWHPDQAGRALDCLNARLATGVGPRGVLLLISLPLVFGAIGTDLKECIIRCRKPKIEHDAVAHYSPSALWLLYDHIPVL